MHALVNWLFLDLNSFFASVEQETQPELRGKPIAVVPVKAETTCCIAVSREAKACGIRTGVGVRTARLLCPHLQLIPSRARVYVDYHHRILKAIERCIPVQQVMSCDEFAIELLGDERHLPNALRIAAQIKQELRGVGSTLRCSIGLAPNRLLAKIACDLQKPDGLVVFERHQLPDCLYPLKLCDVPGIGARMEKRLNGAGIHTMQDLCGLTRGQMSHLWRGVLGDRLWLWLRGENFLEPVARTLQTLSRQHILAPTCRSPDRARGVALKLLHSTARKMRHNGLWAAGMFLDVGFFDHPACQIGAHFDPCNDPFSLQSHLLSLWSRVPQRNTPSDLCVALTRLDRAPAPNLFGFSLEAHVPIGRGPHHLTSALDSLNERFGLNTVYLGSTHEVRREAPTRIPFGPPPPLSEFNDPADYPNLLQRKTIQAATPHPGIGKRQSA